MWHSLHSIMGRPANGFMQKQVTRSQESSSERREPRKRREKTSHNPSPSGKPLSNRTEQLSCGETDFKLHLRAILPSLKMQQMHKKGTETCGTRNYLRGVYLRAALFLHFEVCSGISAVLSCDHPFLNISASTILHLLP